MSSPCSFAYCGSTSSLCLSTLLFENARLRVTTERASNALVVLTREMERMLSVPEVLSAISEHTSASTSADEVTDEDDDKEPLGNVHSRRSIHLGQNKGNPADEACASCRVLHEEMKTLLAISLNALHQPHNGGVHLSRGVTTHIMKQKLPSATSMTQTKVQLLMALMTQTWQLTHWVQYEHSRLRALWRKSTNSLLSMTALTERVRSVLPNPPLGSSSAPTRDPSWASTSSAVEECVPRDDETESDEGDGLRSEISRAQSYADAYRGCLGSNVMMRKQQQAPSQAVATRPEEGYSAGCIPAGAPVAMGELLLIEYNMFLEAIV